MRDDAALRQRVGVVDEGLFAALAPLLADSQAGPLQRCRDHRVCGINDANTFANGYGVPLVDLARLAERVDFLADDRSAIEALLPAYQHELARLLADLRERSGDWFVRLLQALINEGVQDPNDPGMRWMAIGQAHWREWAAPAISIADRIVALNQRTARSIEQALSPEGRERWLDAWVGVQHPQANTLRALRRHARDAVADLHDLTPEQQAIAREAFAEYDRVYASEYAALLAAEARYRRDGPYDAALMDKHRALADASTAALNGLRAAKAALQSALATRIGAPTAERFAQAYMAPGRAQDDTPYIGQRVSAPRRATDAMIARAWWERLCAIIDSDALRRAPLVALWDSYRAAVDAIDAASPLAPPGAILPESAASAMRDQDAALFAGAEQLARTDGQRAVITIAREARERSSLFCDRAGGAARADLGDLLLESCSDCAVIARAAEVLHAYHAQAMPLRQQWFELAKARAAREAEQRSREQERPESPGETLIRNFARLNVENVAKVLETLPADARESVRERFERAAYPEALTDRSSAEAAFTACLAIEDLAPEQKAGMVELRAEYDSAWRRITAKMIALLGDNIRFYPDEDDGTLRPEQWRITADYSQARFERAELNAVMRLRLGTILTEQQFERAAGALQIDA